MAGSGAGHDHRAGRIAGQLQADRADRLSTERARAVLPDHEQIVGLDQLSELVGRLSRRDACLGT
jgi:hypothetical protein